jgi:hypothetical protein
MQHSQGDHLTGPEVRLRVFGYVVHLLIDVVEQGDDKIPCGHAALLLGEGRHATSMEESSDDGKPKSA